MDQMEVSHTEDEQEYKVYKRRFAVLGTVALLNVSNAALWISYSPVASTVADYYNIELEAVNWFSLTFLIMSFPITFASTFIVNKFGLKLGIHIGSTLNVVGAIVRALGTSGIFSDEKMHVQFAVSLAGQLLAATGQGFILFMSAKVSQTWFPDNQRVVSTSVLAMSNPLGIVVSQIATPLMVQSKEDIPLNNWVWMGLAIVAEITVIISFTRGKPKTPPSRSAFRQDEDEKIAYVQQLKNTFTTPAFMYLFFCLGAGIGLFSAMATLTQQLLCPLGYSDVIGGSANGFMVIMGFVGSAISGILADRTKKFTDITKIFFAGAAFFAIFMIEFYLVPNQIACLIIFCGAFGLFGIGAYPIGLELAVEATYPVEESISTAFIFLSGQIHGIFIIALVPVFAKEQAKDKEYLNNCSSETNIVEPKDYTVPLLILIAYLVAVVSVMILFMNTRYKRLEAEQKAKTITPTPL